jgi:hypothetical protein
MTKGKWKPALTGILITFVGLCLGSFMGHTVTSEFHDHDTGLVVGGIVSFLFGMFSGSAGAAYFMWRTWK